MNAFEGKLPKNDVKLSNVKLPKDFDPGLKETPPEYRGEDGSPHAMSDEAWKQRILDILAKEEFVNSGGAVLQQIAEKPHGTSAAPNAEMSPLPVDEEHYDTIQIIKHEKDQAPNPPVESASAITEPGPPPDLEEESVSPTQPEAPSGAGAALFSAADLEERFKQSAGQDRF